MISIFIIHHVLIFNMDRVWLHLSPILIGRIVQNALYNGLELNLEVQTSRTTLNPNEAVQWPWIS